MVYRVLLIKSSIDKLKEVEQLALDLKADLALQEVLYGNILISLSEAVSNAIIHGNNKDEAKDVTIKVSILKESNELSISVSDQGKGFNIDAIQNPTNATLLKETGGRGIFLIYQLADKVELINNGQLLVMNFSLE